MADGARPTAPRSPAMVRLDELEKKLVPMDSGKGKGEKYTFTQPDRQMILRSQLPAWLVYAARRGEGRDQADADRLLGELVAFRARVKLPDAFAPPKEEG